MRKLYRAPSLARYGSLREMTAGLGGSSPDLAEFNNNTCLTGTLVNTDGVTKTITCATTISPTGPSLGSF
jgi:hypothetical protein